MVRCCPLRTPSGRNRKWAPRLEKLAAGQQSGLERTGYDFSARDCLAPLVDSQLRVTASIKQIQLAQQWALLASLTTFCRVVAEDLAEPLLRTSRTRTHEILLICVLGSELPEASRLVLLLLTRNHSTEQKRLREQQPQSEDCSFKRFFRCLG